MFIPPKAPQFLGDEGNDILIGTNGADFISDSGGFNVILANGGDDHIFIDGGINRVRGGQGCDVAVFAGSHADYHVTKIKSTYFVETLDHKSVSILKSVEKIEFEDDNVPAVPVASDDKVFIESGDTGTFDVLANDTGPFDPATINFSNATLGSATNVSGNLQYTANDIGGDNVDDSAIDGVSYTVDNAEGTSNAAIAAVGVIDPLVEQGEAQDTAGNGQEISLRLTTEDRSLNDLSFADVEISVGDFAGKDLNVSFVIDESGSVSSAQFDEEVAAVQTAIDQLRSSFPQGSADVSVQIVGFADSATTAEFDLFDPDLDDVSTGTPLAGKSGGGTDYESGLAEAADFFDTEDPENDDADFLIFVSDGLPNGNPFNDDVQRLEDQDVSRIAFGFGSGIDTSTLDQIDNTGGSEVFNDASELSLAFGGSQLFPLELLSFSLLVNGVEIADEGDLTDLGGGQFELSESAVAIDPSTDDVVSAVARFDTDGDDSFTSGTDLELSTQTIIDQVDTGTFVFA